MARVTNQIPTPAYLRAVDLNLGALYVTHDDRVVIGATYNGGSSVSMVIDLAAGRIIDDMEFTKGKFMKVTGEILVTGYSKEYGND